MGVFSFTSFIITLSIILTNVFDGIDAGRPKHGKKPLPPTVDWRARGAVTPVKEYDFRCGAAYVYAPVAVFEALYFIKTRKLISLSEQQFIDCTSTPGEGSQLFNFGCNGGWPESVLDYMVKKPKHGCEPASVYPLTTTKQTTTTTTTKRPHYRHKTTAKRSHKLTTSRPPKRSHKFTTSRPPPPQQTAGVCKYDPKHVVLNISRWNYVSCDGFPDCTAPYMDEVAMARAVEKAPIVACIYSSCESFRNYDGGFYQDEKCCSNKTSMDSDHVVTIVGYGTDEHKGPYWILKNSFGAEWGEKGYMRIKRGINLCGIATTAIAVHA